MGTGSRCCQSAACQAVLVLLLPAAAFCQEAAAPASATEQGAAQQAAYEAALDRAVDLRIEGRTFEEALREIAERQGVPIRCVPSSLERLGIDFEQPMHWKAAGIPLRQALRDLVESAGKHGAPDVVAGPDAIVISGPPSHRDAGMRWIFDDLAPRGSAVVLEGVVIGPGGRPVPHAPIAAYRQYEVTFTRADADGRFEVRYSDGLGNNGASILAKDPAGDSLAVAGVANPERRAGALRGLRLVLSPPRAIEVIVVNRDGAPVEGAEVGLPQASMRLVRAQTDAEGRATLRLPNWSSVNEVYALKPAIGYNRQRARGDAGAFRLELGGAAPVRLTFRDARGKPIPGLRVIPLDVPTGDRGGSIPEAAVSHLSRTTDENGVVIFGWIPEDVNQPIVFAVDSELTREKFWVEPGGVRELEIAVPDRIEVRGHVVDPAGRPVGGAIVEASGSYALSDPYNVSTTTDPAGAYSLLLYPEQVYYVDAHSADETGIAAPEIRALKPGGGPVTLDLPLLPAATLEGRVTITANQPVPGVEIGLGSFGEDLDPIAVGLRLPPGVPGTFRPYKVPGRQVRTDTNGEYRLLVGAGRHFLIGPTKGESNPKPRTLVVESGRQYREDFQVSADDEHRLRGRVVTGEPPRPVSGARIQGLGRTGQDFRSFQGVTDEHGGFSIEWEPFPSVLHVQTDDGTLAGVLEIPDDATDLAITIAPTATLRARLTNAAGEPFPANREITYGVNVQSSLDPARPGGITKLSSGTVRTDDKGTVVIPSLAVGARYHLDLAVQEGPGPARTWQTITRIRPRGAGDQDLGDLVFDPGTPSADQYIEWAFRTAATIERLTLLRREARLTHQRVLVVVADPVNDEDPLLTAIYNAHPSGKPIQEALVNYRVLAVSSSREARGEAMAILQEAGGGPEIPADGSPLVIVVDPDAGPVARVTGAEVSGELPEGANDSRRLVDFLTQHAPPLPDARNVLDAALAEARRDGKRVLFEQFSPRSTPATRLSMFLDRHRETWSKDYVWVRIDQRWDHAAEVLDPTRQGAPGRLPWFAILDPGGQVLATSQGEDGENIGFPNTPARIEHFLSMLRSTAARMTEDDVRSLGDALQEAAMENAPQGRRPPVR